MILHEGKILNKDLAEWFGVKPNTFNKQKDKFLEELKDFALFHFEDKKIIIDKVINPEYIKRKSAAYKMIRDKVDEFWSEDGLDSCKNVSCQIVEYYGDKLSIAESTAYDYTRQGRNELYGKPFMERGKLGSCTYTWCKKLPTGGYELLSPEEEEIKKNLIKKYFGDTTEKQILVKGMVETGEITKEEAWEVLEELTNMRTGNFLSFLNELQQKVGCKVIRGTLVKRDVIEDKTVWQNWGE